jgi:hypothetical protein
MMARISPSSDLIVNAWLIGAQVYLATGAGGQAAAAQVPDARPPFGRHTVEALALAWRVELAK